MPNNSNSLHIEQWHQSGGIMLAACKKKTEAPDSRLQLHFRFHPAAVDLWGQRARCHHGEILIRQITDTGAEATEWMHFKIKAHLLLESAAKRTETSE